MGIKRANRTERQVKVAVVERLLNSSYVDAETVLISEMTVAGWTRRADIVLANGRLWGFEIKSDADSLTRLPGQLKTFVSYFEKFTIVAAERFEASIRNMIPENVGLWTISDSGKITQKIQPRCTSLEKEAYLSFLNVRDLRVMLLSNGIRPLHNAPRQMLLSEANVLSIGTIAQFARDSVKVRYRILHQDFVNARKTHGTAEAFQRLHRHTARVLAYNAEPTSRCCDASDSILVPSDHPLFLQAPGGPVLRRKVV